jgi:cytochrome c oxidase cbb3-type subunit 3
VSESKKHDAIQGEIIHEYDGIQEADNRLPLWWLWTLYAAMAFSVVYWFYYEEFEVGPGLQQAYYQQKAREAEKAGNDPTDQELLAQLGTPALGEGAKVFAANCVACHESKGQGKIGPNLTDNSWLHGGDPSQIWKTIKDGIPAKGMPPWGPALGRLGVTQAALFVLSIRNTNVSGKAPEGQPYGAPAEATPTSSPAEPAQGAALPAPAPAPANGEITASTQQP